MKTLSDIKKEVEQLSPEEMAAFRDWFEQFQARSWEVQIERGAKAGNLDTLAMKSSKMRYENND